MNLVQAMMEWKDILAKDNNMNDKFSIEDLYFLIHNDGLDHVLINVLSIEELKRIDDPAIRDLCLQIKPLLEKLDKALSIVGDNLENNYDFNEDGNNDEEEE